MSAQASRSDWTKLEQHTFQFRDPGNRERRFIPLRLDDATPRGSLAHFLAVDWRGRDEEELGKLVLACRPDDAPSSATADPPASDGAPPISRAISLGHTREVTAVAHHPAGTQALSASDDRT